MSTGAPIAIDGTTFVAGQIRPADLAEFAELGVTMIVNNRPDGEELGQPDSARMEVAAQAAGMAYRHIPFQGLPHRAAIVAVADAIDAAEGKVLLFCRSGTRSTWVWALAKARRGAEADRLIAQAAAAGYDLSSLPLYLD
jgi:uncharacterized protein (TIGR01244 family)